MALLWLYEDSSDESDFLMSSFEFSRAGNQLKVTDFSKNRLLSSTSRMKPIGSDISPSRTDRYYFPNYTQKRVFIYNNYSMNPSWIWSDKITNECVARVGYNHFISNKGEWNNCFSKFSNRVLPLIFIPTILQSGKFLNLTHYFPYDVKLRLLAHSPSFLANQKARNAIVGAENLLIDVIMLGKSVGQFHNVALSGSSTRLNIFNPKWQRFTWREPLLP